MCAEKPQALEWQRAEYKKVFQLREQRLPVQYSDKGSQIRRKTNERQPIGKRSFAVESSSWQCIQDRVFMSEEDRQDEAERNNQCGYAGKYRGEPVSHREQVAFKEATKKMQDQDQIGPIEAPQAPQRHRDHAFMTWMIFRATASVSSMKASCEKTSSSEGEAISVLRLFTES